MSPDQGIGAFLPMLVVIGIFYFIVIRPEQQKKKQLKEKVNNMKKNDKVVTIGGIHGTVVGIKDKTITLRLDDSVKVEFDKESIASVV